MAVEFDEYRPFDSSQVYEDEWRKMMRHVIGTGVLVSEIDPSEWNNQLQVYADGGGRYVKVKPGEVWIRGHHGILGSEVELPIAANTGPTRNDFVVVRADFQADVIELDVLTGPATLTRDTSKWEVLLATVSVPNNAVSIQASNVADRRDFVGYWSNQPVLSIPIGGVIEYPVGPIPPWALELNGQAVSRTVYRELFALWGTTYGAGDGSTTFNVEDRRGRFPVGLHTGDSSFNAAGKTGGAKTHTLTTAEMPSHTHDLSNHTHTPELGGSTTFVVFRGSGGTIGALPGGGEFEHGTAATDATSAPIPNASGSTGGGQAHNNLPPYSTTRYIVRAL